MEDTTKKHLKRSFWWTGKHHTEASKEKQRLAHLGHKPSPETRLKLSLIRRGKKLNLSEEQIERKRLANSGANNPMYGRTGDKNPSWKGDKVKYSSLHEWIRKYMPKPDKCEFCHKKKKLQAACITGIYNRDFNNWKYICARCHVYLDGTVKNLKPGWLSRS